ncbi:MAG: helix-turn-helix domain-containing protein [Nitrospiraceae bacterium]|nr:MAG: helix-turn-helix domain-containing protein [Nitrospiraceae bacterium]
MNLSVKDVAKLLNVSEKTIYRMIKDEMIPCFRVGGQWRFDRREIASWIEDTRQFSYDTATGKPSFSEEESISVTEFLERGGVYYAVPGDTKETAILKCLDLIKTAIPQVDRERFFESIMEREKLCSTSVGNGIAFPHLRLFREFTAPLSSISLCFLERPIPFAALDNEDVDTLFFIFPKSERRFLRIQAKLMRLLKDEEVLSAVKNVSPSEVIFEVFSRKEAEIFGEAVR